MIVYFRFASNMGADDGFGNSGAIEKKGCKKLKNMVHTRASREKFP